MAPTIHCGLEWKGIESILLPARARENEGNSPFKCLNVRCVARRERRRAGRKKLRIKSRKRARHAADVDAGARLPCYMNTSYRNVSSNSLRETNEELREDPKTSQNDLINFCGAPYERRYPLSFAGSREATYRAM